MADVKISLYPPSPRNVPEDLFKPSPMYRRQVVAVLFSLFVFLLLYAAVLLFTFWLMIKAYRVFPLFAVPVLLVFLFFLKGLFKWHRLDEEKMVEITQEEQPVLFEFIHKVCDELGAPDPDNVYLIEDVNAMVTFQCSVLNLFASPKRRLLIGLGLVNVLTLDEFKGVIAHEFGHMAQGSLRLGVYVQSANRVIFELVFGKDFWDRWVDRLRTSPNAFSALVGHCLFWPTWLLHKCLEGIYLVMNAVSCAMSRQREFNADLASVRLVGSDSTIHSLVRIKFGNDAFEQAVIDLRAAAQHHHYSWDFFHHHTAAMTHLRKVRRKPREGIPPPLPADPTQTTTIFTPKDDDEESLSIFSTHPPYTQLERNAKRIYVRSVIDERSPWLLFQNVEELRTKVTKRINKEYLNYKKKFPLADPAIVQEFIDAEHAETTYDPKYRGMYDDRYVDPGKIGELVQAALTASPAPKDVYASLVAVYPATLVKKMDKFFRHREEMEMLVGYRTGDRRMKGRTFAFRKKSYRLGDVPKLMKKVDKDLDADLEFLKTIDREVFLVHYRMAKQQGEVRVQQILDRYRFHLAAQEIIRTWNKQQNLVAELLGFLADKEKLSPETFDEASDILRDASDSIREGLRQAADLQLPALSNMDEGKRLDLFLVEGKLVKHFDRGNRGEYIRFKWIDDFWRQLHSLLERLKRVHFKSLGVILTLQEQIAKEWCGTNNLALPQLQDKKPEEEQLEVLEVVEVLGPAMPIVAKPAVPTKPVVAGAPKPALVVPHKPQKKQEERLEVLEVVEVLEPTVKPAAPLKPVKKQEPLEVLEVVEVTKPSAAVTPRPAVAVPAKPAGVAPAKPATPVLPKPAAVVAPKPVTAVPPKPAGAPPKPKPAQLKEEDEEVVDLLAPAATPIVKPGKPSSTARG